MTEKHPSRTKTEKMSAEDDVAEHASIEVSNTTKQRFEREKATVNAADANLPDLSDDQFIQSLLDTLEAVDNGYYKTLHETQSQRAIEKVPLIGQYDSKMRQLNLGLPWGIAVTNLTAAAAAYSIWLTGNALSAGINWTIIGLAFTVYFIKLTYRGVISDE